MTRVQGLYMYNAPGSMEFFCLSFFLFQSALPLAFFTKDLCCYESVPEVVKREKAKYMLVILLGCHGPSMFTQELSFTVTHFTR